MFFTYQFWRLWLLQRLCSEIRMRLVYSFVRAVSVCCEYTKMCASSNKRGTTRRQKSVSCWSLQNMWLVWTTGGAVTISWFSSPDGCQLTWQLPGKLNVPKIRWVLRHRWFGITGLTLRSIFYQSLGSSCTRRRALADVHLRPHCI